MRRITGAAFVSLDGVLQAPGGPAEDSTRGFAHGGWLPPLSDEVVGETVGALFTPPYALLLGRGKRLWGDGTPPTTLRLVDQRVSPRGVVIATYEPAGAVEAGTYLRHEPSDRELARRRRIAAA